MSDLEIRHRIYQFFADACRAPSSDEIAGLTGMSTEDVRLAFRRLHDRHMIFVEPATGEIRMANPFSAIPTDYRVSSGNKTWWANCAWDAFAILAALHADGRITSTWADTGEPLELTVRDGELDDHDGYVSFPLPASRWWDDIVFT